MDFNIWETDEPVLDTEGAFRSALDNAKRVYTDLNFAFEHDESEDDILLNQIIKIEQDIAYLNNNIRTGVRNPYRHQNSVVNKYI